MGKIIFSKLKMFWIDILSIFSSKVKMEKEIMKTKTENLIEDYEILIKEYKLIQEKKSKLSRGDRDKVVKQVNQLVSLGHLKAE